MPDVTQYTDMVASQHRKPRFLALLTALIAPLTDLQNLLAEMHSTFDLDTCVGVQEDQTGLWIGRTRWLRAPLTGVYFRWDEAGVGWGEGSWRGRFDPDSGMVSLPDDSYRRLLKAKIAANHWDGTVPGAYAVWERAFGDLGSIILIQDNMDMSMIIGIAGLPLDNVTAALLLGRYIPLKPEGVRIAYYAVTDNGGPLMAWDCDSEALAGWDRGVWPRKLIPTPDQVQDTTPGGTKQEMLCPTK